MMAASLDHCNEERLIASDEELLKASMALREKVLARFRRLYPDPSLADDAWFEATKRLWAEHRRQPMSFRGRLPLQAWLYKATTHIGKEELRRRQRIRLLSDRACEDDSEYEPSAYPFQARLPSPEQTMALHDVAKVLKKLSPKNQETLAWYLNIDDDKPLSDTQRSRLRRLRQTLRSMLERAGIVDEARRGSRLT